MKVFDKRVLAMGVIGLCVLVVTSTVGLAQVDITEPLDYEKLILENLLRNGKYLKLKGKKIGDAGVGYLVTHKGLGKVTKMDLRYNKISPEGAKILSQMPPMPNLKVLILRHNFFSDEGAVVFSKSESFPNLVELQLGWNEIRDAGALAFTKTKTFPKRKKLDLRGNFLSEKTKQSLNTSLSHMKSLKLF